MWLDRRTYKVLTSDMKSPNRGVQYERGVERVNVLNEKPLIIKAGIHSFRRKKDAKQYADEMFMKCGDCRVYRSVVPRSAKFYKKDNLIISDRLIVK